MTPKQSKQLRQIAYRHVPLLRSVATHDALFAALEVYVDSLVAAERETAVQIGKARIIYARRAITAAIRRNT